jgi:hypothetical protein
MAFDLKSISKTRRAHAPKLVIYGPGKIGKSTFAASAPNPIGILTEDGMTAIDSQAFPIATKLEDVYQAIGTLLNDSHDFQTVYIDSLDWLEPLVHAAVCERNGWKTIEQPGYGKGYVETEMEWRTLLAGLDALRNDRGMGVILIAHDKIVRFESPLSEGWDMYTLKLHQRATAVVREWADVVAFVNYKTIINKVDAGYGSKEAKAVSTGERLLHLTPKPAYVAGSRFPVPDTVPLSWDAFAQAIQSGAAN